MRKISRRQLFTVAGVTGAGMLGAAGVGAVVGSLRGLGPRSRPVSEPAAPSSSQTLAPAAELVAALAREHQLLADVEASAAASPGLTPLDALVSDHRAHLAALRLAIGLANPAPPPATHSRAVLPVDQLRAAEQAAHDATLTGSANLRGADAVLLASIAACEAGHVELLV